MSRVYSIVIDTFEEGNPVPAVSHTFNGSSQQQAEAFMRAHLQSDAFFRGCSQGRFRMPDGGSFACRNVVRARGWR